jgi:hypothetical protein
MILAVSSLDDPHAAAVMETLARLGQRCVLLDLATLPGEVKLSFSAGRPGGGLAFVGADGTRLDGAEIEAVWWRRPRPYVVDDKLAPGFAAFATAQVHAAVSGAWSTLSASWMNDPWRDERAGHKPFQLAAAEAAGLRVPPTLISCVPADAQAFLEAQGPHPVIQKPLRPLEGNWRPTRLVTAADRGRLENLRLAPAILQAYVAGTDIRVTVAGDRLIATAIDVSQTESPHDFRPAWSEARVESCQLPDDVAAGIRGLMLRLGLRYAALDFRRDEDGQHWFLEANPAGQWLFLEDRTGQPITRAVAEALIDAANEARGGAPARRPTLKIVKDERRHA